MQPPKHAKVYSKCKKKTLEDNNEARLNFSKSCFVNAAFLVSYYVGIDIGYGYFVFNFKPLSAYPTKWQQPTNCLSVFDHFAWLALKGLTFLVWFS